MKPSYGETPIVAGDGTAAGTFNSMSQAGTAAGSLRAGMAKRYSPYLDRYYERIKRHRGQRQSD